MTARIHPSAVVEDGATLGADCVVGPFCHVGSQVVLDDGVELKSHVVVAGDTRVGARTHVFPFASIGHQAQDLKYRGEPATLTIGSDCLIREGVTLNSGTEGGGARTVIGNRCAFLANSHVGHDSHLGDGIVLSNNVMIAGHVTVGDNVIMGGGAAVIQFTRIGDNAFVGGLAGLENDLIPFGMVMGNRARLNGLNLVGLKRHGYARDEIHALRNAYKDLFEDESGTLRARAQTVATRYAGATLVRKVTDFILDGGERRFCTPASAG